MVGTVARWTVPTVVTMTLGARVLEAKASCPPCQKKSAGVCKACTVTQMINCQCEPCLGPPYCTAVGPTAPNMQSPSQLQPAPGSQPLGQQPGQQGQTPGGLTPSQQLQNQRSGAARDPFNQPLYRDPFDAQRRPMNDPGLYDRLRPDTSRRRP
jgi:hypothetical protein